MSAYVDSPSADAVELEHFAFNAAYGGQVDFGSYLILRQMGLQSLTPGQNLAAATTKRYWTIDLDTLVDGGTGAALGALTLRDALGDDKGDPVAEAESVEAWLEAQLDDATVSRDGTVFTITVSYDAVADGYLFPKFNGGTEALVEVHSALPSNVAFVAETVSIAPIDTLTKAHPASDDTVFEMASANLTAEEYPDPTVSSYSCRWFSAVNGFNVPLIFNTGHGLVRLAAGQTMALGPLNNSQEFTLSGWKTVGATASGTLTILTQR